MTGFLRNVTIVAVAAMFCGSVYCNAQSEGALPGVFSVSSNRKVCFSQGNLQFSNNGKHLVADGTTVLGTWRFALEQWQIVGEENAMISGDYPGWIDLFAWGTSGFRSDVDQNAVNYQPYSTEKVMVSTRYNNFGYGPSTNMPNPDIAGTNHDWGVFNAISNGGNRLGLWRTLTAKEWKYLFLSRPQANEKHGIACVNGVNGIVLLPDEWNQPENVPFYAGFGPSDGGKYYAMQNSYTAEQWKQLESNGAVFLPASGYRNGNRIIYGGERAYYHSTDHYDANFAYQVYFCSVSVSPNNSFQRYYGTSVRLVKDVE